MRRNARSGTAPATCMQSAMQLALPHGVCSGHVISGEKFIVLGKIRIQNHLAREKKYKEIHIFSKARLSIKSTGNLQKLLSRFIILLKNAALTTKF